MKTKLAFVEQKIDSYNSYWNPNDNNDRVWWSESCSWADKGFRALGYEVQGFLAKDIKSLPITRETPVRGSVRTVRTAFELAGVKQPKNIDIPSSLKKFTHRKIWKTTLGEVRRAKKYVHIKPLDIQKGFNGHIFSPGDYQTRHLKADYKILAAERVNFDDEFRSYVLNGKVLNTIHGKREQDFVKELIASYKDAPAAYAIDCAYINSGNFRYGAYLEHRSNCKLALVEVNEGFSCGIYNSAEMSYRNFAKMTEARWFEIVGLPVPAPRKRR